MRPLRLFTFILVLMLALPAFADTVTFNLRQLTGSPSAKRMALTPWGITADGANVQTGEPVAFAPSEGVIITTLIGGTYLMEFQGLRRGQFIAVPGDGGDYNASDLFVVSMAAPEGGTGLFTDRRRQPLRAQDRRRGHQPGAL